MSDEIAQNFNEHPLFITWVDNNNEEHFISCSHDCSIKIWNY